MTVTISELKNIIALNELPDEHLSWILEHSEYREYQDGAQFFKTGDPIDFMWIVLEGAVHFYLDVNGKQVFYYSFENNEQSGGVGGILPYSRMKASPGFVYANGNVKALFIHKKHFAAMERLNSEFIQRLIAFMTDRARVFATLQLQEEKVNALGKLSAGIAHELNNPAAAISRISQELNERLLLNFVLTEKLIKQNPGSDNITYLRKIVELKFPLTSTAKKISSSTRMILEDEIYEWLMLHNVPRAQEIGATFVDAFITVDELNLIKERFEEKAISDVLEWLENIVGSQRIIMDLGQASSRISDLVGAIKSHVHMDRSHSAQPTNINDDIENTITILGHKLREKNIEVIKDFGDQLPKIEAFVSELNQVWMNIIDNAIYAMEQNGTLVIKTQIINNNISIQITDNGTGIPADILPRIFDPFFTTKKVGVGTGIGLDTVSRIVKKHQGTIKVNSEAGNTKFNICLPLLQNKNTTNS